MRTTTRIRLSRATAERLLDEAGALAAFASARCTVPARLRPSGRRFRGAGLSEVCAAEAVIGTALLAGVTGGVALTTSSAGAPQDPSAVASTGARADGTGYCRWVGR